VSTPLAFDTPLDLPCGARLKNRFMKSAMSEVLADAQHNATEGLATLYRTWARGGVGLQVTGNVMIDRDALGEPANVALDAASDRASFERWARAGSEEGTQLWMQLNHPGKQSPSLLVREPLAPSAVPLGGDVGRFFNTPRALTEAEIEGVIARFAYAAGAAKETGFGGVQIHGAHGYLVSQFLSPHHNVRTDAWGGSAEKRRRFALEVYRAIRARVGASFPVGIKLNSADFQRGGFTEDESMAVVDALAAEGVDLIEVSGGTYEAPAMTGFGAKDAPASTRAREAYFLAFAEKVRARTTVPLAVTGGFRSGPAMLDALRGGAIDLVGLARPLAVCPDFPARLLRDPSASLDVPRPTTGIKLVDKATMLDVTYYETQLERMARGLPAKPDLSAWRAAFTTIGRFGASALRPRRA
jgi:2,4-dienoyl-CoA reductase-like NADH-dependent reductase (Old Yellow Enzyme family)